MIKHLEKYGNALVEAVAKYREEQAAIIDEQARELASEAAPGAQVVKQDKPILEQAILRDREARNKAIEAIDKAYITVSDTIGAGIANPPSEEQARVLQMLSLRDPRSVSQLEVDTIAEKVKDNHQASAALADMAVRFKLTPPARQDGLVLQELANDAREIALSAVDVHGSRTNSDIAIVADAIEKRLNGLDQFGGPLKTAHR